MVEAVFEDFGFDVDGAFEAASFDGLGGRALDFEDSVANFGGDFDGDVDGLARGIADFGKGSDDVADI